MLNYKIKETDGRKLIEAVEGKFVIKTEQDALNIVAFCKENETSYLLLHYGNLKTDFFNLKTGLAGTVLQKFITYGIKAAAVIPSDKIKGRFREMVVEARRGKYFRVFETEEEAVKWLIGI